MRYAVLLFCVLFFSAFFATEAKADSCAEFMRIYPTCGSDSACLQRVGDLGKLCETEKRQKANRGANCGDTADACAYRCADSADYTSGGSIEAEMNRHQSCLRRCSDAAKGCRRAARGQTSSSGAMTPTARPTAQNANRPRAKDPTKFSPLFSVQANCRTIPAVTRQEPSGRIRIMQTESQDCTYSAGPDTNCVPVPPIFGTRQVEGKIQRYVKTKSYGICKSVNASGQSCQTVTAKFKRDGEFEPFRREPSYSTCKGTGAKQPAPSPLAQTASGNRLTQQGGGSSPSMSANRERLATASDLGRRNALKCVGLTRTQDNRTAVENICGSAVSFGFCYADWTPNPQMASSSNPYKCNGTGQPSWAAVASVAGSATKVLPLQAGAKSKTVNLGPCMSEVRIDNDVFVYLSSKKLSLGNTYTCRYTKK